MIEWTQVAIVTTKHGLSGEKQMLTPKTVAERLGISISLVYRLCNEGSLKHFRFGGAGKRGRVMIDEQDVAAYVESCRREPVRTSNVVTLNHIRVG